jgi:hypothetical protein
VKASVLRGSIERFRDEGFTWDVSVDFPGHVWGNYKVDKEALIPVILVFPEILNKSLASIE